MAAARQTLSAVSRRPALIKDRKWLATQTALTVARYLLYPTISPRQTYWRNRAEDAAFFMQLWGPIALWGGGRGPGAGLAAGFGLGSASYTAAAWANGEPLVPPRDVVRRIANYSVTSALTGCVVALVAQILERTRIDIDEERRAVGEELGTEEEGVVGRAFAVQARIEARDALLMVKAAVAENIPGPEGDRMQETLERRLSPVWYAEDADGKPLVLFIEELAEGSGVAVQVMVEGPSDLERRSLEALASVAVTAFDNSRRHAACEKVDVWLRLTRASVELTVRDSGPGLPASFALDPDRGLGQARGYVEDLGGMLQISSLTTGGAEVRATWPRIR